MTLEEALVGKEIPDDVRNTLALVNVRYLSFDGKEEEGQLVLHTDLAEEVRSIFDALKQQKFPIQKITPIVAYGWDDDASMASNNTSAFNYRVIFGTNRLSNHSYGRAIDINPLLNPYVRSVDNQTVPPGSTYDPLIPGTITKEIAKLFKTRGWTWGGDWRTDTDWQHFEKLDTLEIP